MPWSEVIAWTLVAGGAAFGVLRWREARRTKTLLAEQGAKLDKQHAMLVTLTARMVDNASPEQAASLARAAGVDGGVDVLERLSEAIVRLPELERIVAALAYYEGLSSSEIADAAGVTPETVDRAHADALRQIGDALRVSVVDKLIAARHTLSAIEANELPERLLPWWEERQSVFQDAAAEMYGPGMKAARDIRVTVHSDAARGAHDPVLAEAARQRILGTLNAAIGQLSSW